MSFSPDSAFLGEPKSISAREEKGLMPGGKSTQCKPDEVWKELETCAHTQDGMATRKSVLVAKRGLWLNFKGT